MNTSKNKKNVDSSTSEYRNIFETLEDKRNDRQSTYLDNTSMETLAKNFHILEEFLKAFKADQFEREVAELASSSQFKEQWQNKRKQKYELKYSYFFRQNKLYLFFSIILLIWQIGLLWFLSVFRVFGCSENSFIFIFCLVLNVLDMVIKSSYLLISKVRQQNQSFFQIKGKDLLQIYLGNMYCVIYSILGIISAISSTSQCSFIILDIIAIAFNYYRLESIQNDIKMFKSNLQFKNYIKLFNLMSTLIMIIHFFAVLMYFSTNFSKHNYLADFQLSQQRTWINLYIYSFYFSGTTVLTVGYGDILPKNIIQIFIVLLMQIFGVVMIVYLNGQVGNILCSLRREKQNLENDISVLERLKKNFTLSLQTTHKIKQYLIDNRRADEENNIYEQKALLAKISSGLRQQATLTNHINIIKHSLFLLTNFSTKAHILISNKLLNHIYSPNQNINQLSGSQKLFFIKKGQICFYMSKKDNENFNSRKIVKRIAISNKISAVCNCFGYVSLIMGKPNRLKIFSKDFSDCYSIDKSQFLEAITCDNMDFEKYHEMREGYISDRTPEKYEASQFFSQKDHYVCEVSKIITEYLKERCHSKRRNKLRKYKKRKLIIEVTKGEQNLSQSQSESQLESCSAKKVEINKTQKDLNSCLSLKQRKKKYEEFNNMDINSSLTKNLVVQRKYAKRYCKNAYNKKISDELKEKIEPSQEGKLRYSDPFDIGTSFTYFYPDSNMDMVMRKVNYDLKVLSIFTNMFERTLDNVNRNKESSNVNGDLLGSTTNIEKYRRQKDFIDTINIRF